MIKKIIAGTVLSAMTLFALPNSELDLVMVSKAAKKKVVVLANMKIDGEIKQKFGNLYDEYQKKLIKYRMNEFQIITNYASKYKNMTDESSDKLILEWLSVEEGEMALKKEYVEKFKKIMPSSDVIRYLQIENRIKLATEIKQAKLIPLAKTAVAK